MVLGMAAAVVNPTEGFIERAFAAIRNKDVHQWAQEHLGPSLQSQRRLALQQPPDGTKTE